VNFGDAPRIQVFQALHKEGSAVIDRAYSLWSATAGRSMSARNPSLCKAGVFQNSGCVPEIRLCAPPLLLSVIHT
jgi:hypothetical protein